MTDAVPTRSYSEYKDRSRLRPSASTPPLSSASPHLAAATGRSKAYYLRQLVTNGLEDREDFYLASATIERVRKSQGPVYGLDDVERQLGLAD